jgi:thiol:disulfide interchange protein DsbD
MKNRIWAFFATLLIFITSITAQFEHITWSSQASILDNQQVQLVITAKLDKGWHLYSQFMEDGGPLPTWITIDNPSDFELQGVFSESKTKSEFEPVFDMTVIYFDDVAIFTGILKKVGTTDTLKGNVNFMICQDGMCLPPDDYTFAIDIQSSASVMEEKVAHTDEHVLSIIPNPANLDLNNPVMDCGGTEFDASYWVIFILGLLGGLVSLITPCVFPMIPLTVSFFTKGGSDRKAGMWKAILYGLSIIGVYVTLSIPFHFGAESEILNNISTNVYLNIFFFVIFIFFALSFFGYYELTLPSSWANKADKASDKGGIIGIVFMALVLAIVSFSCTGPLLGTVLAGSLTADFDPWLVTFAMLGFGIGLGLPFALFAAFPSMLKSMPQSGGWLNNVKVVLGFIELMMALKFLSNADLVYRFGLLHRETFFLIWILLSLATALYLFGIIRFPHDTKGAKISKTRLSIGVLFFGFSVYLFPGILPKEKQPWAPNMISGFPPPAFYSWYANNDHAMAAHFTDYYEALAYAKETGKPLLIDFTGWACVNCRKMEENVWSQDEVNYLLEQYVVVSLYVDDRLDLPAEMQGEIAIPLKNGGTKQKTIITVGDRWSAFESIRFGQVSQPFYVLLSPDEILLNHPVGYTPDAVEYADWLKCGLVGMGKIKSGEFKLESLTIGGAVEIEEVEPITWNYAYVKNSDGTYTLEIKGHLDKGWHTYSQFIDPNSGPVPTELLFTPNENIDWLGTIEEIGTHTHFDPVWNTEITDFSGTAHFRQVFKLKNNTETLLQGSVYFMMCNDEMCLPPSEVFFELLIQP